jgi:hypothetical protein
MSEVEGWLDHIRALAARNPGTPMSTDRSYIPCLSVLARTTGSTLSIFKSVTSDRAGGRKASYPTRPNGAGAYRPVLVVAYFTFYLAIPNPFIP